MKNKKKKVNSRKESSEKPKNPKHPKHFCRGVRAYMEMVGMDVRHWTR